MNQTLAYAIAVVFSVLAIIAAFLFGKDSDPNKKNKGRN